MTREPDRYEAKARKTLQMLSRSQWSEKDLIDAFAAALRQAADEMRQASIDACDDAIGALQGNREVEAALECIKRIRALASPAAAPAAEPCPQGCDLPAGHEPPCAEYVGPSEPVAPADVCRRRAPVKAP